MVLIRPLVIMILFSSLLMSGCATKPFNYMQPEVRGKIESVDTILVIAQHEIIPKIETSNIATNTGGGLIFALMDVAIEQNRLTQAEKNIQPIRDGLIDYDFDGRLKNKVQETLRGIKWLQNKTLTITKDASQENTNKIYQESSASAVLFIFINYNITLSSGELASNFSMSIFPKSKILMQFKEESGSMHNPLKNTDNIFKSHGSTYTSVDSLDLSETDKKEIPEYNMLKDEDTPLESEAPSKEELMLKKKINDWAKNQSEEIRKSLNAMIQDIANTIGVEINLVKN